MTQSELMPTCLRPEQNDRFSESRIDHCMTPALCTTSQTWWCIYIRHSEARRVISETTVSGSQAASNRLITIERILPSASPSTTHPLLLIPSSEWRGASESPGPVRFDLWCAELGPGPIDVMVRININLHHSMWHAPLSIHMNYKRVSKEITGIQTNVRAT
jgi:hypothetical protein